MEELSLKKFEEAAEKVKEVTLATNLVYSEYFSNQSGNKVYLKPENMQYTGAYKVRGAYYKISTMSEDARKKAPGIGLVLLKPAGQQGDDGDGHKAASQKIIDDIGHHKGGKIHV